MAFTRQTINNVSTFDTGGGIELISNPEFSIWTNLTDLYNFIWEIGGGWRVQVDADDNSLAYNYNDVDVLTISTTGISYASLDLTPFVSNPSTAGYNEGDVINVNGALYVLYEDGLA